MLLNKAMLMLLGLEYALLLYTIGKARFISGKNEAVAVIILLFNVLVVCTAILTRVEETLFLFRLGIVVLLLWVLLTVKTSISEGRT